MEDNYNPLLKDPYSYIPGQPGYMNMNHIAEAMNIHAPSVSLYTANGNFPKPDLKVGRTPLWKEETVMEYLDGRPATLSVFFYARMSLFGYKPRYRLPYPTQKTSN